MFPAPFLILRALASLMIDLMASEVELAMPFWHLTLIRSNGWPVITAQTPPTPPATKDFIFSLMAFVCGGGGVLVSRDPFSSLIRVESPSGVSDMVCS